jgi:hypothetical protein
MGGVDRTAGRLLSRRDALKLLGVARTGDACRRYGHIALLYGAAQSDRGTILRGRRPEPI